MAKKKEDKESADNSDAATLETGKEQTPKVSRAKAFLSSDVVKAIAKKYKGDELTIAAESKAKFYPRVSTGIFPLDYALCGGWAVGGVHVGFGFQHSGKTTNLMRAIGNAQNLCGNCWTGSYKTGDCACKKFREVVAAFINVESTWDEQWAKRFMDTDRLIYNQPSYGEQAIDITEALILSGEIDVLCLDSLAFLVPMVEIEKSMEEESMGLQARLIGKAVRKILMACNVVEKQSGRRPTIFFTNQIRMKIGVMFGSPEVCPGGHAYHFLSTSEVRFAAGKVAIDEATKENPDASGKPLHADFRFRVDKNKAGGTRGMEGEYRVCLSPFESKKIGDILDENSIIDLAEKYHILTGGGASWKLFEEKIGAKGEFEKRMLYDPDYKKAVCAKILPILLAKS